MPSLLMSAQSISCLQDSFAALGSLPFPALCCLSFLSSVALYHFPTACTAVTATAMAPTLEMLTLLALLALLLQLLQLLTFLFLC